MEQRRVLRHRLVTTYDENCRLIPTGFSEAADTRAPCRGLQSEPMNEKHFYADVDLPFHVWVRERNGATGFRWVLREASEVQQGPQNAANVRGRPPISPSA